MRLAHADLCFPKLPCLAFPKRGVASWKWNDWAPGKVKLRSGVPLWPVRLFLLPDVCVFSLLRSALSRAMSLEDVFASHSLLCRPRLLRLRVLHRTTLFVVTVEDVAYWPVSGLICLSAVVIVKHKMLWYISGKNDRYTVVRWLAVHILVFEISGKWSSYGQLQVEFVDLKGWRKMWFFLAIIHAAGTKRTLGTSMTNEFGGCKCHWQFQPYMCAYSAILLTLHSWLL